MDKNQLLWQLSAEQFAALEMQLYLDTHANDANALGMFNNYQKNYLALKEHYEKTYGPITVNYSNHSNWNWVNDPWPWEKEAN